MNRLLRQLGAKIPIAQAAGHMIVNIGGGSTESAVISLGELSCIALFACGEQGLMRQFLIM